MKFLKTLNFLRHVFNTFVLKLKALLFPPRYQLAFAFSGKNENESFGLIERQEKKNFSQRAIKGMPLSRDDWILDIKHSRVH